MKLRKGFVSNSSSSSFIIDIGKITPEQKERILHYHECGSLDKCKKKETQCEGCCPDNASYNDQGWTVFEKDGKICGDTVVDNFDFYQYLTKTLGIQEDQIEYYEREYCTEVDNRAEENKTSEYTDDFFAHLHTINPEAWKWLEEIAKNKPKPVNTYYVLNLNSTLEHISGNDTVIRDPEDVEKYCPISGVILDTLQKLDNTGEIEGVRVTEVKDKITQITIDFS